jgi:YD repeat-containing protein
VIIPMMRFISFFLCFCVAFRFAEAACCLSSLFGQYSFNNSNELTALASIVYAYDNNGNMTTKTSGTNSTGYTWDLEIRLSSVTLPSNGGTVSFRYDPFGRRIQKALGSSVTNYVYDGANITAELNASGAVVASYTQGAGIDEPLAMRRGGYIAYYHADGLGSVTSLTDSNANTVATYVYDSFGNTTPKEGIFNPYRYTGREQDPETGLYY